MGGPWVDAPTRCAGQLRKRIHFHEWMIDVHSRWDLKLVRMHRWEIEECVLTVVLEDFMTYLELYYTLYSILKLISVYVKFHKASTRSRRAAAREVTALRTILLSKWRRT